MLRRVTLPLVLLTCACAGLSSPYRPTPSSDAFDHPMVGGGLDPAELDRLVEKRAPIDLGCETQDLTVKDLCGTSVAVLGCGGKAVYIYLDGPSEWTLDSVTKG